MADNKTGLVITAHPASEYKSLADVIAAARAGLRARRRSQTQQ
jgi:hypothetical protein